MQTIKVLIPDAEERNIRQVIMCFSKMGGYELFLVSDTKDNFIKYSRYCKHFFAVNEKGYSTARLNKIIEIIEKYNIDIIMPTSVDAYRLIISKPKILCRNCDVVLIPSKHNYELAANKRNFYNFCTKNRIAIPNSTIIGSLEVVDSLDNLSFPVIIKPFEGDGGIGIRQFDDRRRLNNYIIENIEMLKDKYLIQEYINGETMCMNVLCYKGDVLTYTVQKGTLPPPDEFNFPRGIELIHDSSVCDFIKPVFKKLKWSGIANVDLLRCPEKNQYYILEINPRIWGTILASLNGGVNFIDLLIKKSIDSRFNSFPLDYFDTKFAYLNIDIIKKYFTGKLKIKLSDTNMLFYLVDPIPTLMAKLYQIKKFIYH